MTELKKRLGIYAGLLKNSAPPEHDWDTNDLLLFEMVEALSLRESTARMWDAPSGRKIPVQGIIALGAAVESALRARIKLTPESLLEFSLRIQKACIDALGEHWDDYRAYLNLSELSDARMREATKQLYAGVTIDFIHDFTNLAIYAKDNPCKVYVHRGFKRLWTLTSGETVDLVPPLMVHEVVEKCLLDELRFSERGYQKCHQVAQRIEQAAVEATGISWTEYQDDIMAPVIMDIPASFPIANQPPDADTLPMVDLGETSVVEELRLASALSRPSSLALTEPIEVGELCTATKLAEGLYHLLFIDGARMAETLMRFQEYYESPKYRGTHFTREEFEKWYPTAHNGRMYVENWASEGFNMPSIALKPFYEGWFSPLTEDEAELLRFFNDERNSRFYVIATAKNSPHETLEHEIAHGMYFLHDDYKKEADAILQSADIESLKKFLSSHPEYGYHTDVLQDEAHAYLMHPGADLKNFGFDVTPYADITKQLQSLYLRFVPKL